MARLITVSWYPGNLKTYSQQETAQLIVGGLQDWQAVSAVRFGVLPAGQKTDITFYPYTQPVPWAMAAYQQTGQILYSTRQTFQRDWARMAFAHEVGHIFGWGHATNNRTESLMHPRGSSVMYFDHNDARRAWSQFGKFTTPHRPRSLKIVGDRVRAAQQVFNSAKIEFQKHDEAWKKADLSWRFHRDMRNAIDRKEDPKRWLDWHDITMHHLGLRSKAGANRKVANNKVIAAQVKLKAVSDQWLRIDREWKSIGGISVAATMEKQDGPCSCFHAEGGPQMLVTDLKDIFAALPNESQPLPGLEVVQ